VYQEFFGLNRRPFSAVPCADDFVASDSFRDALESIVQCISQSRGIAVVTAPTGGGKTMLCKQVAHLLHADFRALYLNASSLPNRQAFLQSALFELGADYVGLSEQEARLRLLRAVTQLSNQRLLLILDEAQSLNSQLFEELRTLSEYAPNGIPPVQVLLCGSFELEEKLTDSALAAFAQRIGIQVCLSPLTLPESAALIRDRLRLCGVSEMTQVFSERALELICLASDGNLRCLAQLTDHSLLLAFGMNRSPVDEEVVRAALDDLKELPLRWNEIPPPMPTSTENEEKLKRAISSTDKDTDEFPIPEFLRSRPEEMDDSIDSMEIEWTESESLEQNVRNLQEESPPYAVYEVGGEPESEQPDHSFSPEFAEQTFQYAGNYASSVVPLPPTFESIRLKTPMYETPVLDRYTLLDRYQELPESRRDSFDWDRLEELSEEMPFSESDRDSIVEFETVSPFVTADEIDTADVEQSLLETIQQLRRDVQEQLKRSTSAPLLMHPRRFDVVEPEAAVSIPFSVTEPKAEETITKKNEPEPAAPVTATATPPEGRFAQLFTRLRSRRTRIQSEESGR